MVNMFLRFKWFVYLIRLQEFKRTKLASFLVLGFGVE